jgi:hypothetical protein
MKTTRFVALIILALAIVLGSACSDILGPDEVRIRVRNMGTVDFESTIVNFSERNEQYGALRAGETSGYRTVDKAYSYAYVEVHAGGLRIILQPIDYVGEDGDYTYELSIEPTSNQLSQRLVRD